MLELLCIIFKEGSQTEKWNQITPAYENKTTHTHTFTTLYTKSTTTKCLKLHYQEQMPHQNKMKDIRGENFYNSARQGKWKEGK